MSEYTTLNDMSNTKAPTQITSTDSPIPMSYDEFRSLVFEFFKLQDYECNLSFQEGFSKGVQEDNKNTDIIVNMNSLIYNYCREKNKTLESQELANFHNLFEGIQLLTKSMKQYDDQSTEKIFIAHLVGYILKLMRNFYHA